MSHLLQRRVKRPVPLPMAAVLLLAALCCAYPLIPQGTTRDWVYDGLGLACSAAGIWGASRLKRRLRLRWMLVLGGFAGWVVGDAVFSLEQHVFHVDFYPVPSDAVYLGSYVLLAVGLLQLTRASLRSELTPLLDSAIITVGFGIVVATFLVAPVAADSTLNVAGRVVASAYPVADVLLLGVLVNLWTLSGLRSTAFRLLLVALAATMVADVAWNVIALRDPDAATPAWVDLLWLLGYLASSAAACTPSAGQVDRPQTRGGRPASPRARMVALGCGLMLPGITLFIDAIVRDEVPWQIISIGSVVLSVLVLLRMGLLLRTVEVQAVRLSALARNDALTGAPNRRTWDHELGRAMQLAREHNGALCVALIDLDHFKVFNDQFGHQAGDRLLREAVAAWGEALQPGELLARYGGEEFGLLLPGLDAEQAALRLQAMQELTPDGQGFSAGVAVARPELDPSAVVALADRALYEAKNAGRRCVRIADSRCGLEALPAVRIALQPIVDLATGRRIGQEARSHFHEGTSESIFSQAHREGYGLELEASALRAALRRRPSDGYLSITLSLPALASPVVQSALGEDLRNIVIEIAHHGEADVPEQIAEVITELKDRGARIAIADWGREYFDSGRFARLRADAVTLNRTSLAALRSDDQEAVMGAAVRWAHDQGLKICADGIETREQWETAAALGFDFGQGTYFEEPAATPEEARGSAV